MSNIPLTLEQLRQLVGQPSTADEIRNAAAVISIPLAVLSAFATQRAASLGAQVEDIGPFKVKTLRFDCLVDVALVAFGMVLLLAMAPLFASALGEASFFRARSAFFTLFCLLYVACALIWGWTVRTLWVRTERWATKSGKSSRLEALLSRS